MPELPDVEVFKRYLDRTALHHSVRRVELDGARLLHGHSATTVQRRLRGRRLDSSYRWGKFLFVALGNEGGWLVLHFGMTGFLQYYRDARRAPAHPRLVLELENGYRLAYDSQRKLGEIDVADDIEEYTRQRQLGPDALRIDKEAFVDLFNKRRGSLKGALMDQKLLSGIGNIYSDEILFQAKLHPKLAVGALALHQLGRLHRRTHRVLQKAIDAKANPDALPRSWLLPHRTEGAVCPRCGHRLERHKAGGRHAWLCPRCQRRARKGHSAVHV